MIHGKVIFSENSTLSKNTTFLVQTILWLKAEMTLFPLPLPFCKNYRPCNDLTYCQYFPVYCPRRCCGECGVCVHCNFCRGLFIIYGMSCSDAFFTNSFNLCLSASLTSLNSIPMPGGCFPMSHCILATIPFKFR